MYRSNPQGCETNNLNLYYFDYENIIDAWAKYYSRTDYFSFLVVQQLF